MNSALRLTTMLLWLPAATAMALQVPPERPRTPVRPIEPRVIEPRRIEPRIVEPRFDSPRFDKWRELEDHRFELLDKLHDMPDVRFESKLDANMFMQMDMEMRKLDSKLFELDAKLGKTSWPSDAFHYDSRLGADWKREPVSSSPRAAWIQGDPADSLYKSARELLNRGEWRRAATASAYG